MAAEVNLSTLLPEDPLANIFSYLSWEDVLTCKMVCHRFRNIVSRMSVWKKWCDEAWLLKECPNEKTWQQLYLESAREWGRYRSCYADIRKAWNIIEDFTRVNCPDIYDSLNAGVSEDCIRKAEESKLEGLVIPDDMRCSFRIHNGQRLVSTGVLGSMSISSYYRTEALMDLSISTSSLTKKADMKNCIQVTFCINTGCGQFMALSEEGGYSRGEIFWPCSDDREFGQSKTDQFISASCFSDWLCQYAEKLSKSYYPVIEQEIYTFAFSSSCTTNGITVRTTTAFLPDKSRVNPPAFFFTYRISISMDPECSEMNRCQLMTRHWYITDADGLEEEVHGAAVVGAYPIMYPGALHEYISCTKFSTPTGIMTGHYTFKYLNKSGEFNVTIPPLNFQSLPFVESDKRLQRVKNRQFELGAGYTVEQQTGQQQGAAEPKSSFY